MKWQVIDVTGPCFPSYFKTKKEALAYAQELNNRELTKKRNSHFIVARRYLCY